eukprot:m.98692 g.98692  ORF g.98692 m.98692 type:complete len:220 (+) comp51416_c0_seq4:172-831(+)
MISTATLRCIMRQTIAWRSCSSSCSNASTATLEIMLFWDSCCSRVVPVFQSGFSHQCLALLQRGETALMYAAHNGATECIRELIAAGADTRAMSSEGNTALDLARNAGEREAMAVLKEHEQYLAQLGSHTKPALREHQQLQASDDQEQGVTLSLSLLELDEQRDLTPLDLEDKANSAASKPAVEPTSAVSAGTLPQAEPERLLPFAVLDLGDLELDLPN